jgi:hypothetical protein
MKHKNASDPIKSLIDAARPEMDRLESQAGLGFESRLTENLNEQNAMFWSVFEIEAIKGLKYAGAVAACTLLLTCISLALDLYRGMPGNSIERLILGF